MQGVYFRVHAQEAAKLLGLAGWVKNDNQGTVSIEAEGDEKSLEHFVAWCKEGAPQAQVSKVEVTEGPLTNLRNFSILE